MDVQLQELIDRIKTEGVEKAQEKAGQLVEEAKRNADEIVSRAQREAERIVTEAKAEADRTLRSGRESLGQAARDLLIGLKRSIESLFARVIEAETTKALSGDVLERAVIKVFEALPGIENAALELSPEDATALESRLRSALADRFAAGLSIAPSQRVSAGFRISVDGGAAYYDFTPKEIASVLVAFLNPRLAEILSEAASAE